MIIGEKEYLDFNTVPQSKGVPRGLFVAAAVMIVALAVIAGASVTLAGYGHYWPSDRTLRVEIAPSR